MNTGGAETLLMNIYRKIDRKKFVFYFLCFGSEKFDYEDEIEQLGGVIVRIKTLEELGIRKYIKEIMNVIKQNNIDIVHAHTYYHSIFSLIAAKRCGIKKRIVHSHCVEEKNGNLSRIVYDYISKKIINWLSNTRLACTEEAGKALFGKKNFIVINNGIDIDKFVFNPKKRKKVREELNISDKTIVVGNVARFYEVKNHQFLVDIFFEYQKKNKDSRLILIGTGPLKEKIERKVKEYAIEDRVLFLGVRKDVEDLYNAMDVFIFPSLHEGLGIVLIEAQSNGLKCLVNETIPKNVKILDDFKFLSLSEGAIRWAEMIEPIKPIEQRKKIEINDEYDIKNTICKIKRIYEGENYAIN